MLDLNTSGSATDIENLNTSDSMTGWGGKRLGAGRPKDPISVRSVAAERNRYMRKRVSKTRIWEGRQLGKIHPLLLRMFGKLPSGRGQKKYRKRGIIVVPNTGLSKNMCLQFARVGPYTKQFEIAAITLFGGEVPDEFKPLFEADEETLWTLAIESNPEIKRQIEKSLAQQQTGTTGRNQSIS